MMAPMVLLMLQALPQQTLAVTKQMKAKTTKQRNGTHLTMAPVVLLMSQEVKQSAPTMSLRPSCHKRRLLRLPVLLVRVQRTLQRG